MKPRPETLRCWLALLLAASLGFPAAACGTSCREIEADRAAFLARRGGPTDAPHAIVNVPFRRLEALLAEHARAVRPQPVKLPLLKAFGVAPRARIALRRVLLRPAAPGKVGFRVELALESGGEELVTMRLDAEVAPQLMADRGEVRIGLRPDALRGVRPTLSAGGKKRVARAIREQLPKEVRLVARDAELGEVASRALGWVVSNLYRLLRDNLLVHVGEITHFSFRLPPQLPIRTLSLDSSAGGRRDRGALHIAVQTTLPVADGLAGDQAPGRLPADAIELRLAGGTVAALSNRAMAEGKLPSRFNSKGKSKRDGAFAAGLGWEPGSRPLRVHLWRTEGECLAGVIAGTPEVSIRASRIRVAVTDGELRQVRGPALTELAAWLRSLWAESVKLSVEVASEVRFTVAGQQLQAAVIKAGVDEDELALAVRVVSGALEVGRRASARRR